MDKASPYTQYFVDGLMGFTDPLTLDCKNPVVRYRESSEIIKQMVLRSDLTFFFFLREIVDTGEGNHP